MDNEESTFLKLIWGSDISVTSDSAPTLEANKLKANLSKARINPVAQGAQTKGLLNRIKPEDPNPSGRADRVTSAFAKLAETGELPVGVPLRTPSEPTRLFDIQKLLDDQRMPAQANAELRDSSFFAVEKLILHNYSTILLILQINITSNADTDPFFL